MVPYKRFFLLLFLEAFRTAPVHYNAKDDINNLIRNYGVNMDVANEFVINFYKRLESGKSVSKASGHPKIDRSILGADTFRTLPVEAQELRENLLNIKFNPKLVEGEKLVSAELRMRIKANPVKWSVYRVQGNTKSKADGAKAIYDLKTKPLSSDGYVLLDFTNILQNLIESKRTSKNKLNVSLNIINRHSSKKVVNNVLDTNSIILVIYSKRPNFVEEINKNFLSILPTKNRQKRRVRSKDKSPCHLRDFVISYDELGPQLSDIVFPKTHNIRTCSGHCQIKFIAGEEAKIMTPRARLHYLAWKLGVYKGRKPCCSPTRLKEASVIRVDISRMWLQRIPDYVATECGCT